MTPRVQQRFSIIVRGTSIHVRLLCQMWIAFFLTDVRYVIVLTETTTLQKGMLRYSTTLRKGMLRYLRHYSIQVVGKWENSRDQT